MKEEYEAPTAIFVLFENGETLAANQSFCSGHCEVVCTDECEYETCAPVCPSNCYVIS